MTTIIFIWIGKKLPSYAKESLEFCKKNNFTKQIILLTNAENISLEIKKYVDIIDITEDWLEKTQMVMPKGHFTSDFWINTSMRFLILNDFIIKNDINKFYHAELDNAIFNLDSLDNALDRVGEGIFVPRDNETRAIASLIYCNRSDSIAELISLYQESSPPLHDMDALGIYSQRFPDYFFALPTESFQENQSNWELVNPELMNGIFDAAAVGQYLLGVDPIHCRYKPCRNRFINENCKVDFSNTKFIVDNGNIYINYYSTEKKIRIFNIHLHSKNWNAFNRIMAGSNLINRLNQGEASIVSNHIMIIGGPLYRFLRRFLGTPIRMLRRLFK